MLPVELRRFILTSIPSVPYLEALLLLHGEPASLWTSALLAKRLYITEKQAQELLSQLLEAGIATRDAATGYLHYEAAPAEVGELIDALAVLYSKNLLEITHLIHSKIDRKVQQFADAFKLRKDT